MNLRTLGNRYIQPSPGHETIVTRNATIADIVKSIILADGQDHFSVARFAPFVRKGSDYETLRNVWQFTRKHIRYERDNKKDHLRQHVEAVKSPAAVWRDKTADCKGMSLINGAILKHLGFCYTYRVAFYDPKQPNQGHIYPVVTLDNGRKVVVDSVSSEFDYEEPYWKATDYSPEQGSCSVSGLTGPKARTNKHKVWIGLLVALFIISIE